jgi:monoamine oxidase
MARALREIAQAQIFDERNISLEETLSRAQLGAISRRELLKITGAFGAAVALAACTPSRGASSTSPARPSTSARPSENQPRVAVIGAGLAGVTAAYRLSQVGIPVQLYEARDRIGGRCWTARGFADGQTAEHGGEFIDTRHVHIRALAQELNLPLDDLWKGWLPGFTWLTFVNGNLGAFSDWRDEQQPIIDALKVEAERLEVLAKGKKPTDAPVSWGTATDEGRAFDEMSMAEWLDENVPGVTGSPLGVYLDEVMGTWYGLSMASLSATGWLWFYLIPQAGADERWHVRGGNDQIPLLAADRLPPGTVHLETPLQAVRKRSDGGYELRFGGMSPVLADYVIMTTPWTTLRNVDLADAGFDAYRMTAIEELGMGTDVKLLVQYDRRPNTWKTPAGIWSGGMEQADAGFETWESSVDQKGKSGLITVFAGGQGSAQFAPSTNTNHGVPPEEMVAKTIGHIDDAVPGTADRYNGRAWLDYWTGDPWTAGSYAAFTPGQTSKYWRYTGLPDGRMHFAGEHTSIFSQGYLNGGVESGQRAAIEVMEAVGVEVPKSIARLPYSRFG